MGKPLSKTKIQAALEGLAGWKLASGGDALVKTYLFKDFPEAMSFMVRAAFEAEAMNHHPEWTNVYNRLAVRLSTHDAGGKVTAKDVGLAWRLERISGAR